MSGRFEVSYVWKIVACAVAYLVGVMLSGVVFRLLGIALPSSPVPNAAPAQHPMLLMFAASLLLAVGLMPLAYRLQGSFASRATILVVFVFVSANLNNVIEGTRFMVAYAKGGASTLLAFQTLPFVLFALTLAIWIWRDREPAPFGPRLAKFFSQRSPVSWSWRIPAAVIGFPVIYFFFGLCVSPIVVPYYRTPGLGLVIPSFATMFSTAIGRSALYLVATLPVLILWNGTRRQLAFALGLAFTVMVGWAPLLQASFMPTTLRIVHSLEICADSFVYGILLVVLLTAVPTTSPSAQSAGPARDEAAGSVG
ncbi:MAG: hypothetical protein P8Z30_07220 [Acidobacteriota bacterium]